MPAHVTGAARDRKDSRKQSPQTMNVCLDPEAAFSVKVCQSHSCAQSGPCSSWPTIPESQGEMVKAPGHVP